MRPPIKVIGVASGDGECWCLLVPKDVFQKIVGRPAEDEIDRQESNNPLAPPEYCYRIYPSSLLGLSVDDKANLIELTVGSAAYVAPKPKPQLEKQTCGRRMTELGPWDIKENDDEWTVDSWSSQPGSDRPWKGPGPIPRTCSFCGGINPDDALVLKSLGWWLEPAKSYKLYMHGPKAPDGKYFNPVPPVKVYTQHFTKDQLQKLLA